ncbi:type II toxin-antitoxin system Phd/YefM family antitoxin [Glaciibacter psychrotolerans]|uniref:Prevent-host-death family protein n=1 Tax=Glaciibacter psychrotolerans TaxID=670054 RepID=A0A7Z0EDA8_9MICO|nr:type II toxin-antitoxin system prevent-host-death family antitoxin [Leifsonia psychrotolerans]NYJ18929.1 prevent-host-death family protein [Leifsonia psychrotolerans]
MEEVSTVVRADPDKGLFGIIQQVNDDHTAVEVVSERGTAVIRSKDDYDALTETAYLLRNPANADDPFAGIGKPEALKQQPTGREHEDRRRRAPDQRGRRSERDRQDRRARGAHEGQRRQQEQHLAGAQHPRGAGQLRRHLHFFPDDFAADMDELDVYLGGASEIPSV